MIESLIMIGIMSLLYFSILHGVNYVLVKLIMLVSFNLFHINWYNKFWSVYLLLIILEIIFGKIRINFKR